MNTTTLDGVTVIDARPVELAGVGLAGELSPGERALSMAIPVLVAVSAGASAYHGYKRNRGSVGWAIGWGLLGGLFPIITPAIALAQGFGKPAGRR